MGINNLPSAQGGAEASSQQVDKRQDSEAMAQQNKAIEAVAKDEYQCLIDESWAQNNDLAQEIEPQTDQEFLELDINSKDKDVIKKIQRMLLMRGYDLGSSVKYPNGIDGIAGKKTRSAHTEVLNAIQKVSDVVKKQDEITEETTSDKITPEQTVEEEQMTEEEAHPQSIVELAQEGLTQEEKDFLAMDIDELHAQGNREGIKAIQRFLVSKGEDLGPWGPNKDGIDGVRGNKDSKTQKAYYRQRNILNQKLHNQETPVQTEKTAEKQDTSYTTKEAKAMTLDHTVMGIKTGKTEHVEYSEIMNMTSLRTALNEISPVDLYNEILAKINEERAESTEELKLEQNGEYGDLVTGEALDPLTTLKGFKYVDFLIGRNYTPMLRVLEKYGYIVHDMRFDDKEAAAVGSYLESILKTQENLQDEDYPIEEKIKILLDYNADGVLDDKVYTYTNEKEVLDKIIQDQTHFENLLTNLGYDGLDDFDAKFTANYYQERNEFHARLGNILSNVVAPINPVELFETPDGYSEYLKNLREVNNIVTQEFESDFRTKFLKESDPSAYETLRLNSIGAIIGGSVAAGASFDVQKATGEVIASLQVGWGEGGIPVIGISKRVAEDSNYSATIGLINGVPYVAGEYALMDTLIGDLQSDFFPNKIEDGDQMSIMATGFAGGQFVGLKYSELGADSLTEIKKLTQGMSDIIDAMFDHIRSGKSFADTGYENTPKNKKIYERMQSLYKSSRGADFESADEGKYNFAVSRIKQGALQNYENSLYQDAANGGLNPTGISLGIALLANYFPTPVLGVHGEEFDQEWRAIQKSGDQVKIDGKVLSALKSPVDEAFIKKVDSYEEAFNNNTRWNLGAKALLAPGGSPEEKWEGLITLVQQQATLRATDIKAFLDSVETEGNASQKAIVLATFIQFAKKSADVDNGQIESWNNKTEELIAMDEKRSKGFNTLLISSGLDDARKSLHDTLKASKGNIGETTLSSIAFDATATLFVEGSETSTKGVETYYSNIKVLTANGKPVLVDVNDSQKIKEFIVTIEKIVTLDSLIKDDIINGLKSGALSLKFAKDPNGFDDILIPFVNESKKDLMQHNQPKNSQNYWNVFYANRQEEKTKGVGDGVRTEPFERDPTDVGGGGTGGVGPGNDPIDVSGGGR